MKPLEGTMHDIQVLQQTIQNQCPTISPQKTTVAQSQPRYLFNAFALAKLWRVRIRRMAVISGETNQHRGEHMR